MSARKPLVVDVDAILDATRFRGLPLTVMLCVAVTLALDGFDIQAIGFVAPALKAEFQVERSALAPVLAASLLGMALGGLGVGPIGDRWGRRKAVLISTALFGVGMLLASTAATLDALTFWRLLTGIGLGGAMPNATALMVEFTPPQWRSQAVAAAIVGVPVGGMFGAALAAEVIPAFGWRALFVIGGALPLVWLGVMYFKLPESPRYLATRRDESHRLAAVLNRLEQDSRYTSQDRFILDSLPMGENAGGIRALFARGLVKDTVACWVIFTTNIFAVYAYFNWAPVVLTSLGLEQAAAVRESVVFNLAGVAGALVLSWLIPRFGSRRPLAWCALVAVLSLAYLGWLAHAQAVDSLTRPSLPMLTIGIAMAGFTIIAVQIGMFAVVAQVYPTECRSSGVGWAIGIGRLGGILSSFAGGVFATRIGGEGEFFIGVAGVLLLTFAALLALRRHILPPIRRQNPQT